MSFRAEWLWRSWSAKPRRLSCEGICPKLRMLDETRTRRGHHWCWPQRPHSRRLPCESWFGRLPVESCDVVGGAVVTRKLTLPGFKHDRGGTAHSIIQSNPMIDNDELGLQAKYGLKYLYPEIPFLTTRNGSSFVNKYSKISLRFSQLNCLYKLDLGICFPL